MSRRLGRLLLALQRDVGFAYSGCAMRANGTTMPGPGKPTVTQEQNSDSKIDEENRKLDRTVSSICKGC